tara:strand:+ start:239 stop:751 length:513 start_codon:yes stop_codon:yes gene_type:complete
MKKSIDDQGFVERIFEGGLWGSRYVIVFGVFFSMLSSIVLFLIGSYEIVEAIINHTPINDENFHANLLVKVIGAVDLYLIGLVLMIFGFGIYELFISKIDIARGNLDVTILEVESLDELKQKIIKVIIMVLIVSFFERVLKMNYETPLEMLYFAVSILALSLGVYLVRKK